MCDREGYVRKRQKCGIETAFRRVAEKGGASWTVTIKKDGRGKRRGRGLSTLLEM